MSTRLDVDGWTLGGVSERNNHSPVLVYSSAHDISHTTPLLRTCLPSYVTLSNHRWTEMSLSSWNFEPWDLFGCTITFRIVNVEALSLWVLRHRRHWPVIQNGRGRGSTVPGIAARENITRDYT